LPEDDRLKFTPQEEPPPLVAQFNVELDGWEILVNDQWVSISHLIDSLVEMRTILEAHDKGTLP
jgi:hypothetical protein